MEEAEKHDRSLFCTPDPSSLLLFLLTSIFQTRLFATKASDKTHAHVFRADIPSKILHALDNPTEDMDNLVWPAIQHIQVPFEPHATFSERVAGQLLAGLKTRAPEETPRGEKEGR
ncbi:hypothetical protein FPRO04_13992 [Fusarium proliferatum]|uniref:Uncharacterized protein n=1 Tax=Gibberella intermedia TaxID=948311 RepID=A0A365N142_GIBIN|nr:hypothetical protein FPRO03_11417 [Fusarium proliferatum]KAG4277996.1 hypothetical protein FPRO04_13992 [Fusarium proliferatum]RBA14490.1 hypothetical protein FPRO05_03282 [Fusarium proliferatum]